ncbi:putative sulfate exporter family transporter [Pyxidicoccus fallax]|uniref:Putative sulfate exporter family transporter n=1 Tax=Pyxidicoccus fallax TaxID=394095 RepID=A0A848LIC4_9BACT|nr:putative sulfate exporter family transporter [Pyxidicoccus fallax]NMO17469.1 putative sulfate exporter family transporter [Pyxidicoccus fallax]NPC80772.1 putative sulfate exporter family transporter [Pyxidicoccus fallax]
MNPRAHPTSDPHASPGAPSAGRWLVPLGAILSLMPFVSTGTSLVLGIAVALTVGNPHAAFTRRATQVLLSLAVMGLGAGMDLRVVAEVGAQGVLYTVVGIATCLLLGTLLARALGVSREAGLLISIGKAICGGSAIAAVVPVLRPKEHEVSVALGTVFLLNAVALFVFPPVGHALGLDAGQFGLWSALAIHDTSSVVGAALRFGPESLALATTVKLARALWIVPLTLAVGAWMRAKGGEGTQGRMRWPWFILGFIAAAALVTWVPALRPAGDVVAGVSRRVLVLTLFLIGANLSRSALRSVGTRPLLQGFALWVVMAALSLGAIRLHLIS